MFVCVMFVQWNRKNKLAKQSINTTYRVEMACKSVCLALQKSSFYRVKEPLSHSESGSFRIWKYFSWTINCLFGCFTTLFCLFKLSFYTKHFYTVFKTEKCRAIGRICALSIGRLTSKLYSREILMAFAHSSSTP